MLRIHPWLFAGFAALALALTPGPGAVAHDGPSVVIASLSEALLARPDDAMLRIRRAEEYRLLRDYDAALRDVDAVLVQDPANLSALLIAAELYALQGRSAFALALARDGVDVARDTPWQGSAWIVLARVQEQSGDLEGARSSLGHALAGTRVEVDWYLQESRLLARLQRPDARVAALRTAVERNPSVVLEEELTDALIGAGEHGEALRRVDEVLARSNTQSRWLLRRAKILKARGEGDAMRDDLALALFELASRGKDSRPNPSLLQQQIEAYALLGDRAGAAAAYDILRRQDVGELQLQEARAMLSKL